MIERWLVAIRDHPDRPPALQRYVLHCLALRMDWTTGRGYASNRQLAADSDAEERTVRRATKWGRDSGHLLRTRRGHRINAETAIASEWQLARPGYPQAETQPDTGDLLANPTGQNGQPNRTAEQPNRTAAHPHQESVFIKKLSSSARGSGADAPRADAKRSAACRSGDHEFCPFGTSCPCDCHRVAA